MVGLCHAHNVTFLGYSVHVFNRASLLNLWISLGLVHGDSLDLFLSVCVITVTILELCFSRCTKRVLPTVGHVKESVVISVCLIDLAHSCTAKKEEKPHKD